MTKLDKKLPTLYAELHSAGVFQGDTWEKHAAPLHGELHHWFPQSFVDGVYQPAILDYGCGPKGGLLSARQFKHVVAYDPYVETFSAEPWSTPDLTCFFSSDVWEHMPLSQIVPLTRRLCKHVSLQLLYLVISTRAANKTFSNGLNVHITVHSADWWHGFLTATLGGHFDLVRSTADLVSGDCTFVYRRPITVL